MRRAAVLVAIVFVVLGWSRRGRAEERARYALETEATPDARACADAEVLRAKVAERLGRDPFTAAADARGKLRVAFAKDKARGWTAEITLADAAGQRIGARALAQPGATCEPLASSVVFTIAVLLEDLAPPPAPPDPAPPPAPPQTAPPPAPEPAEKPPPRPPERTARLDVSLGPAGAVGGAPSASAGGELAFGLDVARSRVELSGRMYLPASSDGDVAVRTRLVHARLAPCHGWVVLSGCVVAAIGSVSGEAVGDAVASSRLEGQLYAAGGVGVLSRLFVVDDLLFVRASIDVLFAATRAGFDVGDRRVWTVPIVSTAGAIAFGVRLP